MTPPKRQTHRQPHSPSLTGRCSAFLSACLRGLCVESVLVTVEIPAGIDRTKAWDLQFLWSLGVGAWRFHVTMQRCNPATTPMILSRHDSTILRRVNSTKFD